MLGQHVYLEQDLGQANAKNGIWLDDYYIADNPDGSHYVWAASPENKLEMRTVELGDADEELQQHQIVSGLSTEDYICQPQSALEEGLPVRYNDASGEGETESMYNWDEGAAYVDDGYYDDEDYYLDEFGTESEEDWYFDETEEDFMNMYNAEEASAGIYDADLEAGVREVQSFETDNEGFVIVG